MDPVSTEPVVPATSLTAIDSGRIKLPPAEPRPLISDQMRRPAWLWLASVLPLTLLFLSGQYTYSIIAGDLSVAERWECLAQGAVLLAAIAICSAMALRGLRASRLLSSGECVATLLISIAAMGLGIRFSCSTIPWEIPDWIVGRDELLYRSFCLGMPGAFYALLLLFSSPPRHRPVLELLKSIGIAAACVGGTFFTFFLFGNFFHDFNAPEWLVTTLILTVVFAGGTVMTGAVIRTSLLAYTSIRRLPTHAQQGFMFLIGLVGPVAGLILNAYLPFPTDFQAPIIYILAAVNGVLLLLPVSRSIWRHRVIWLAQCAMFPFSAYFLVVFLPWLPLSPFALIVIGSGFLILVPLVLGLVHGYRIVDGYREEIRDGVWWKPALGGIAAVLVIPAALGWSMWQDRQTLDEALNYIYAPDYRKDITFPGDLGRLQSTLQHLRDSKHGIFLPLISPLYNAVVFHNLVLPDAKIDNLQRAFFGGAPANPQADVLLRSNSNWHQRPVTITTPATDVALKDIEITSKPQGAVTVSRLTLVMQNHGDPQSEYVTTIHIPEGVYVSDFGLYLKNDLVPARIVEKKTALWVYEKITVQEHRDPGLLIYKSRNELELRVYPFDSGETRKAEIELVHPNAAPTSISIGDRTVELNPGVQMQPAVCTACATPAGGMAVAEGTDLGAYAMQRTPYLDVLIDCSKGAGYTSETIADSLRQARREFPDAKFARVTAINFEARDIVSDLTPVDQLDAAAIQKNLLPSRGGFLEDRFLKRGLLQAYDLMQKGAPQALLRPQFVILTSQDQNALQEGGLEDFLRLAPDAHVIYTQKIGAAEGLHEEMVGHYAVPYPQPGGVVLWQWAGHYAASPAGARTVATFPGSASPSETPLLYQASTGRFAPIASTLLCASASRLADGVRTWAAQDEATLNPSLLQNGAAELIGLSKQTRILVSDSSFIAVESPSQWRIMEEKEKQKLANKQVFELEEPATVPEPATWILLGAGMAVLGAGRRLKAMKFSGNTLAARSEL